MISITSVMIQKVAFPLKVSLAHTLLCLSYDERKYPKKQNTRQSCIIPRFYQWEVSVFMNPN